jgi:hypothetical protein
MSNLPSMRSVICTLVFALAFYSLAHAGEMKPWAKHCTLVGIPTGGDPKFTELLHDFVRECVPVQACVLSCMRNHCDVGAGGCFHDCGTNGFKDYGPPEALAELYAKKDKRVCPSGT